MTRARRRWTSNVKEFEQLTIEEQYKVARLFGGRRMYIPTVAMLERRDQRLARQREAVALLNTDSTYNEVAATLGVSVSTVLRDAKFCST